MHEAFKTVSTDSLLVFSPTFSYLFIAVHKTAVNGSSTNKRRVFSWISGSHGGEYEDGCLHRDESP
jgi:hypothetical protein